MIKKTRDIYDINLKTLKDDAIYVFIVSLIKNEVKMRTRAGGLENTK